MTNEERTNFPIATTIYRHTLSKVSPKRISIFMLAVLLLVNKFIYRAYYTNQRQQERLFVFFPSKMMKIAEHKVSIHSFPHS